MRLILVKYAAPLASLVVLACLVFLGETALWVQKVRGAHKVSQVLQERTASQGLGDSKARKDSLEKQDSLENLAHQVHRLTHI